MKKKPVLEKEARSKWSLRWTSALIALILAATGAIPSGQAEPEPSPVVVAGGPVGGSYYRLAGELCEALNRTGKTQACVVLPSGGSEENLELLESGQADFAILQSDWLYRARLEEEEEDEKDSQRSLRSLSVLQGRPVTLVVAPDSEIENLDDLKGKRVSFGPENSALGFGGHALTAALGWELDDYQAVESFALNELPAALCSGAIDAFVLPLYHPSRTVAESLVACEARLMSLKGEGIEEALIGWPFMSELIFDPNFYPEIDYQVQSFGLLDILATRAGQPEKLVAAMTKVAIGRFPVVTQTSPSGSAPVHSAAVSLLVEAGVLPAQTSDKQTSEE